jgi:hypothetical protein
MGLWPKVGITCSFKTRSMFGAEEIFACFSIVAAT